MAKPLPPDFLNYTFVSSHLDGDFRVEIRLGPSGPIAGRFPMPVDKRVKLHYNAVQRLRNAVHREVSQRKSTAPET